MTASALSSFFRSSVGKKCSNFRPLMCGNTSILDEATEYRQEQLIKRLGC